MISKKLIKGIVCGLMLTTVVGTTVFAGTVNREVFGYNIKNISDSYTGDVGVYEAVISKDVAGIRVRNVGGSSRYYTLECDYYNSITGELYDLEASSVTLAPGGIATECIYRDYIEPRCSYRVYGCGYYGTHTTSGLADVYSFYIDQYEE